jgi:hypothetical protein
MPLDGTVKEGVIIQSLEVPGEEYQDVLAATTAWLGSEADISKVTQALLPKLRLERLELTVRPSTLFCVHAEGRPGGEAALKFSLQACE